MQIQLTIGRDITNNIVVDNKHISNKHAIITLWKEGEDVKAFIEDLNSSNGTYKNGLPIKNGEIEKTDIIRLANFEIDLIWILNHIPENFKFQQNYLNPKNSGNLDFTREFLILKNIYDEFKADVALIKRRYSFKINIARILVSSLPAILGIIFWNKMGNAKYFLTYMSSPIVLVLSFLFTGNSGKIEKQIEDRTERFYRDYTCPNPNCKRSLGITPFTLLQSQKKCQTCGAIWTK